MFDGTPQKFLTNPSKLRIYLCKIPIVITETLIDVFGDNNINRIEWSSNLICLFLYNYGCQCTENTGIEYWYIYRYEFFCHLIIRKYCMKFPIYRQYRNRRLIDFSVVRQTEVRRFYNDLCSHGIL